MSKDTVVQWNTWAAACRTHRARIAPAALAMTVVLFLFIITLGCMTHDGAAGGRETINTTPDTGKPLVMPHEGTFSRLDATRTGQGTRIPETMVRIDFNSRTRVYDVMAGETLEFEGMTNLAPGDRLLVEVEQPGFGPTAKTSKISPTGASVTTTVVAGGNSEKNRWSVDIPTHGWNCGEYTVTVTGIGLPVREEYPITLLCC